MLILLHLAVLPGPLNLMSPDPHKDLPLEKASLVQLCKNEWLGSDTTEDLVDPVRLA
ncbi:hypothetical protein PtA15_15A69 [Puccinia triticina]|uniref:Uncharacterized protein n=1 Tax=Puccinia triticina TaxID=208348 RepID=A0ABY7D252_9BASI|nr:uncharacterized protein PtA15_15A69 [Puccinia triticina]WAQ91679.1 hypothetical protein PtA15_15A69 [Puccinia triticina]WAR62480.1 hypothetical protein PtB15_15B65 [Puccinia triticina]